MSFPSTPLRFAGDWNAVTTFVFGEVVLAGAPAVAYACGVQSSLNVDPSVQPSTDWFPFPPDAVAGVTSLNTLTGAITLAAGTGISLTPVANTITIANTGGTSTVYQATYYKSANQTMTSGSNTVTFDLTSPQNNTGGYITHVNGTTTFTVVQTGLYNLGFNCDVLDNNAVYSVTSNKTASIFLTRSAVLRAVIQDSSLQATTQPFQISLSATFYLQAGDVLDLRVFNSFTGTAPAILGLQATFDLGTFFTWTFLSTGTALAYQNPPPVIQVAGTTALIPTTANTQYILTSGVTQNFTTAGLGAGNAGAVWYLKSAQPSGGGGNDITIQHNGVAITGATSVLHQRTNTNNTSSQTLYWTGNNLVMY
jgi:hypothetical protein